jgi:GNAT superfamily N-acetyltransferase
MTFTIREAQPGDARDIARVHIVTWQAAYADILPAEFLSGLSAGLEHRVAWWADQISSAQPPRHTLVATEDGGIVGFADVGPSRDSDADPLQVGELNAIYVLRAAWGRGIGQALMAEALKRLREGKFHEATLWVLAENERARRYYEAAGWTTDGSARDETISDVVVREVRYRISL